MTSAAILDVDGTLVDTNYHHAIAWYRAMRRHGVVVPVWRIHRHIGMGGDQLVAAVAGEEAESEHGDEIREVEKDLYMAMIDEVEAFDGASELIDELRPRADRVVLASSAKEDEVEHYLDLLDARERVDAWTTSADVDATKPQPDLVRSALEAVEAEEGLLIGDTVWDVKAAKRVGVGTAAVRTGGFAAAELREAGALAVFDSVAELRARLDELPVIGDGRAAREG